MTFGRPGAIPEEYIQLDLPTIIPLDDGTEATYSIASVGFFNSTMHAPPFFSQALNCH